MNGLYARSCKLYQLYTSYLDKSFGEIIWSFSDRIGFIYLILFYFNL